MIRLDCELKLSNKADELKREYQRKMVELQKSYSLELNTIKHVFNAKLRNCITELDGNYRV